jgi:hypothetical protein
VDAFFAATSANEITLVLDNLIVNPTSAAQDISALLFTVSTGETSGSIDPGSSGLSRTVAGNGTYTDNGSIDPGHWPLQTSGSQLDLNDLTGGHPIQTILGAPAQSNVYSNANGSIAGNGPHNGLLFGSVTFALDVAGVTSASTITSATFSFNTEAGDNIVGAVATAREPASTSIIAISLASLAGMRVIRRHTTRSPTV